MDHTTYYPFKIYSGNSVSDVLSFVNSLSQMDDDCEIKAKRSNTRREKVKSPSNVSDREHRKEPTSYKFESYPRFSSSREDGFKSNTYKTKNESSFTNPFVQQPLNSDKPQTKTANPLNSNFSASNLNTDQQPMPKPVPMYNLFKKPYSKPQSMPQHPPPVYPVFSPVDRNVQESMALITKLMSETGIRDTTTLVQKLKTLMEKEAYSTLIEKCPELRSLYVNERGGNCIDYLDVEDVLRVIIPGARLCNNDIAQLNKELYEIINTQDRSHNLKHIDVMRNNTKVRVYDFARSDFPVMHDYLTNWAAKSSDHILIA